MFLKKKLISIFTIFIIIHLSCATEIENSVDEEEIQLSISGELLLDSREPSNSIEILFEDENGKKRLF